MASKNCSVVIHACSGPTRMARSLVIAPLATVSTTPAPASRRIDHLGRVVELAAIVQAPVQARSRRSGWSRSPCPAGAGDSGGDAPCAGWPRRSRRQARRDRGHRAGRAEALRDLIDCTSPSVLSHADMNLLLYPSVDVTMSSIRRG